MGIHEQTSALLDVAAKLPGPIMAVAENRSSLFTPSLFHIGAGDI